MPFLIADANDKSSLADLAGKTDVIIATAGPFAKYGTNVVEASLEQGTHYCDITGEIFLCGQDIYLQQQMVEGEHILHATAASSHSSVRMANALYPFTPSQQQQQQQKVCSALLGRYFTTCCC